MEQLFPDGATIDSKMKSEFHFWDHTLHVRIANAERIDVSEQPHSLREMRFRRTVRAGSPKYGSCTTLSVSLTSVVSKRHKAFVDVTSLAQLTISVGNFCSVQSIRYPYLQELFGPRRLFGRSATPTANSSRRIPVAESKAMPVPAAPKRIGAGNRWKTVASVGRVREVE